MKQIQDFEIINHGPEHEQYFQGCGVSFTKFDECYTGYGWNAKDAYEDALEGMAQADIDIDSMPKRPKGIRRGDKVSAKSEDVYWYVSVRVKLEDQPCNER